MIPKKNYLLFITIIFITFDSFGQLIGRISFTFTDSSRNNRLIPTEIYYPSLASGNEVPIAPGTFPLVVFGHGFVMVWSAYENIWTDLVTDNSSKYIVAFPKTESGFSPVHADFGRDLSFLTNEIRTYGVGSIIKPSSIAKNAAIMGHSMGGGAAFLGAQNNNNITTVVSLAAANTNPSSINAASNTTIPTLLFSGTNDCVTPPKQHQDLMYDSCSAFYKTQIYIKGGGHCFFANSNFNCNLGESTCTPVPTISRTEQQTITGNFLRLWLAYFLYEHKESGRIFQDSLAWSNKISYKQNNSIYQPSSFSENPFLNKIIYVYPNPASNKILIKTLDEKIGSVCIFNLNGEMIFNFDFCHNDHFETIDVSNIISGIYFLKVNNKMNKIIIQN